MTEASAPTQTAVDTQTWGAISWRRTHRLDTPEEQVAGYKVIATFSKPQFRRDVEQYIALTSRSSDWVEYYSVEVVPFVEQDEAKARKLVELQRPASRPWKGD